MKLKVANNIIRPQPDPFVCPVEGGWVMYVTGVHGIEAYSANTPMGLWEHKGTVLQMDEYHEYWAPCLYWEHGWYYLYFSCRKITDHESLERLHVAKSQSPYGPFTDVKQIYDCFSIDPHVVRTDAGLYLWFCMDRVDTDRVGTRIFVQQLADPETPVGDPVQAVAPSFDEEIYMKDRYVPGQHWHTIEGPFWLQVGQWQYLMYSGACYQNDTYHIGYASAKTSQADLTKVRYIKHTKKGEFVPLMTKNEVEEGVGHHSVICWQGQYYAVYHARDYTPDARLPIDQRTARICKLHFADGIITAELLFDKA